MSNGKLKNLHLEDNKMTLCSPRTAGRVACPKDRGNRKGQHKHSANDANISFSLYTEDNGDQCKWIFSSFLPHSEPGY